jgi:hypothetical protein
MKRVLIVAAFCAASSAALAADWKDHLDTGAHINVVRFNRDWAGCRGAAMASVPSITLHTDWSAVGLANAQAAGNAISEIANSCMESKGYVRAGS